MGENKKDKKETLKKNGGINSYKNTLRDMYKKNWKNFIWFSWEMLVILNKNLITAGEKNIYIYIYIYIFNKKSNFHFNWALNFLAPSYTL